jgi:ADP-ribose pyrophosphatase YjhB (NUDIX family)
MMRGMRDWVVGGAIVLSGDDVLLVRNVRRNGSHDWTPPGGVIEIHAGETLLDGLAREVEEETGLRVTEWAGPLYEVSAVAPDLGWHLRVEVHLALAWEGELHVDDPDGIVVEARFVGPDDCATQLDGCHPWVREPLSAWLGERWEGTRPFGYRVDGADVRTAVVTRTG